MSRPSLGRNAVEDKSRQYQTDVDTPGDAGGTPKGFNDDDKRYSAAHHWVKEPLRRDLRRARRQHKLIGSSGSSGEGSQSVAER